MSLQNGMTPLHLAVWHSVRANNTSTVEALLEHQADVCARDHVITAQTTGCFCLESKLMMLFTYAYVSNFFAGIHDAAEPFAKE